MNDLSLRSAALVVFLALIGGGVYGAQQYLQTDVTAPTGLLVEPASGNLTAVPGSTVGLTLTVKSFVPTDREVQVRASDNGPITIDAGEPVTVGPEGQITVDAVVRVAEDADLGTFTKRVTVDAVNGTRGTGYTNVIVRVAEPTLTVTAVETEKAIQPGYGTTFGLAALSTYSEPVTFDVTVVDDAGLDVDVPDSVTVAPGEPTGVWAIVSAPAGADAGTHTVTLRLASDGRTFDESLTVTVLADNGEGLQDGEVGDFAYYGRHLDGLFSTNMEAIAASDLPEAAGFQAGDQALTIRVGEGSSLISGLQTPLIGMLPGESRTVVVPPEEGYGGATLEDTQNRTQELPRDFTIPIRNETQPLQGFAQLLAQTGQGTPDDYEVGDEIEIPVPPDNRIPALIVAKDSESVTYRFQLEVGDVVTLYPGLNNMSTVVEAADDEVTFRTTPTFDEGERFTLRPEWPDATEVREVTNDTIVFYHTPEVGSTYEAAAPNGNQQVTYTVKELTDTDIVVEYDNPHALAGYTLHFDFTRLEAE